MPTMMTTTLMPSRTNESRFTRPGAMTDVMTDVMRASTVGCVGSGGAGVGPTGGVATGAPCAAGAGAPGSGSMETVTSVTILVRRLRGAGTGCLGVSRSLIGAPHLKHTV